MLGIQLIQLEIRHFPDGESYIRFPTDLNGRYLWIYGSLFPANDRIIELMLICKTAREMGAETISIITPYLPYMRQDIRFQSGEVITASIMQQFISRRIDELICIEPHLHRITDLNDLYKGKARVLRATGIVTDWIKRNVPDPVLIGPDSESKPWVSAMADKLGCPYVVLSKIRQGDFSVSIDPRGLELAGTRQPILVDDILSTGRTMKQAASTIYNQTGRKVICIGIHAIFAGDAERILHDDAILRVVTTNSIPHETNEISIDAMVASVLKSEIQRSI
jgi:ribose-phosphate pyrophosphokinase